MTDRICERCGSNVNVRLAGLCLWCYTDENEPPDEYRDFMQELPQDTAEGKRSTI